MADDDVGGGGAGRPPGVGDPDGGGGAAGYRWGFPLAGARLARVIFLITLICIADTLGRLKLPLKI